jgi:hypothetical protein
MINCVVTQQYKELSVTEDGDDPILQFISNQLRMADWSIQLEERIEKLDDVKFQHLKLRLKKILIGWRNLNRLVILRDDHSYSPLLQADQQSPAYLQFVTSRIPSDERVVFYDSLPESLLDGVTIRRRSKNDQPS